MNGKKEKKKKKKREGRKKMKTKMSPLDVHARSATIW